MRDAKSSFTTDQRARLARAVQAAEARTSAEIVPAVATDSGRYDRAEDMVGLLFGLSALAFGWTFFAREDSSVGWGEPPVNLQLPALLGLVAGGFVVGALLAGQVGWLRRLFTPRRHLHDQVDRRAGQMFFDQRIHHTQAHAGVLIYVSLFERRAVVLADRNVWEAVGASGIDDLCAELRAELRTMPLTDALCASIARIGERLERELPRTESDVNELADVLITLDAVD